MTRTPLLITLAAAAAALVGCNSKDHPIVAGGPQEDNVNDAANGPVTLPPSVAASKSYRCKDNSLVYIDWLSDGTARVKKTREEVGTTAGAELKGDAKAATVSYKGQSCKG